jgi:hypothetical protein
MPRDDPSHGKRKRAVSRLGSFLPLAALVVSGCTSTLVPPSHRVVYDGLWLKEEGDPPAESTAICRASGDPALAARIEAAFLDMVEKMTEEGRQIFDLTILAAPHHMEILGLWEPAEERNEALPPRTVKFGLTRQELVQHQRGALAIESYETEKGVRFAVIWQRPFDLPAPSRISPDVAWASPTNSNREKLCAKGFHAVEIEPYLDESRQRRLAVLCRRASEDRRLLISSSWNAPADRASFRRQGRRLARRDWRMVDFEQITIDGVTEYLGLWKRGLGSEWLLVDAELEMIEEHRKDMGDGLDPRKPPPPVDLPPPGLTARVWRRLIDLDVRFGLDPTHQGALHDEPIMAPPP